MRTDLRDSVDELPRVIGLRIGKQFAALALLDYTACAQHDRAVAHDAHHVEVVADEGASAPQAGAAWA